MRCKWEWAIVSWLEEKREELGSREEDSGDGKGQSKAPSEPLPLSPLSKPHSGCLIP